MVFVVLITLDSSSIQSDTETPSITSGQILYGFAIGNDSRTHAFPQSHTLSNLVADVSKTVAKDQVTSFPLPHDR
jgi:hypothetical protein